VVERAVGDDAIPERLKAFIADQIDSVVQLEILLLLHGAPGRGFSAQDVARELRIDPGWAGPQLAELCARGTLACVGGPPPPPLYRYEPRAPETRETIDLLARMYSTHRVTLTALIFSKPPSPVRSFSDAFRLRRDRPDG
jgi:hypothetical protein